MFNFDWRRYTKVYIIFVALLLLGASFGAGVFYGYENRPGTEKVLGVIGQKQPQQFKEVDFNLFWEVWSKLEEKYVDKDKINRERLIYGAISGLVKALKDPNSEFLNPEVSRQFQQDIRGSFEGIGAEIGIRKGVLTIIAPLKNSPAERAGVKAGDKVLKVDDTVTADLALDEAVRLIRGPKGTEVKLTVFRESLDQSKEIAIVRDTIRIEVLSTDTSPLDGGEGGEKASGVSPDGIFVIKLNHFTENAAFEFRKAVQEFYRTDSKKLILDLRNNPGGFLQVAVDIASWFLPPGEVVVRERYADNSEEIYRSSGYRLLQDIPLVILVNEGSASASEIVAGALRDHKGVKLIGSKTFGKGSVQEVIPLPQDASLKITIAKWLTPKGIEINGTGLEPDIKVEVKEEENGKEGQEKKDLVMEKAVEVLKEL